MLLIQLCSIEYFCWFGLYTSNWQTARIFSAMLDELVMDATLQSHLEVTRGRTLCTVCNTQWAFTFVFYVVRCHSLNCTSLYEIISCGSSASLSSFNASLWTELLCLLLIVHVPGNNGSSQPSAPAPTTSSADTPSSASSHDVVSKAHHNGSLGTGTSTPTSVKADGTVFFECVSCSRQVWFSHLLIPNVLSFRHLYRLHRTDMHLTSVHVWVSAPLEGVQCGEMSSQS